MQSSNTYVNIAAYKFITFNDTVEKRPEFRALCEEPGLKGTILLSPEGINLFLAGLREPIDCFLAWLRSDARFADIERSRKAITTVTFCTDGIRCEKAAIHMQNVGYDSVFQLEGGILKYFDEVGDDHYTGDCFVFDYRTALNPKLEATDTKQCFACRAVVTPREQLSAYYVPGGVLSALQEGGAGRSVGVVDATSKPEPTRLAKNKR